MSVADLERNGLTPERGPGHRDRRNRRGRQHGRAVPGGARLRASRRSPAKTASTTTCGRSAPADVLPRSAVQPATRPMDKATWAGAIDPVGGDTLAWLLRSMAYRGAVAVSGLTGGIDVHTTVIPFILRGVKLLGIDSVMCPMDERLATWRRLATDMKPANLGASVREIGLADLPDAFETLKKGAARGRFVVKLENV